MASKLSHFSLDISKLNFVLQVLRHYKFPEARWFDFGLNLGLPYHTLKAIESANKGDPSNCLMECLAKWLTEGSDHTLVWQTLANALRGMNALAVSNNIHKTMADPVSEILQFYIGRLAQVVLTEESVDLLHTEGLISKDTLTEVKSCGCSLVGDPMLLILSAVAEDHSKLCTLTSILMKSKEAMSLASDIIMEYRKSFPSAVTVMPSCQQASTSTSSRSGQLQDSSSETQVTTNTDATAQMTARDNVDMLKEMGLISLTIGYYTVYDEHGIDEKVKSLMKKLEMVESERDDLLEENAKLKDTIDTLGISYEGREVDESNKSSIQSSESEKEESKKKMTKAMQMEIDHLRSSLQSKTGKDQSTQSIDPPKGPVYVAIRDREARLSDELSFKKGEKLEIKKEYIDGWRFARSLDTDQEGDVYINYIKKDEESELSTLESLELFHYAMTENVDIPKIKEIKTRSNVERASLFWSLIKQDSVLLDQLRKKEDVSAQSLSELIINNSTLTKLEADVFNRLEELARAKKQ
uniref:SH3 domain-containing protein n=1 Tax=Amphimedon queenslandica TaxID=400682 RepID=A0A1X7TW21_AMPQE